MPAAAPLARAGLMTGPTPLELLGNLSRRIGVDVWAKRDDVHTLGLGGNKVRKLDLILGQALRDGCDAVVTYGGLQSNHCRLTAAAAAKLGLVCTVVLSGVEPEQPVGNVLLDYLFGARVRYHPGGGVTGAAERAEAEAERLREEGLRPRVICLGGSDALGTAAYALAVEELGAQCRSLDLEPTEMYVTAGSCGTAAGIAVGAARVMPDVRVTGVNIAALSPHAADLPIEPLARQAELVLGWPSGVPLPFRVLDDFAGSGYGAATAEGRRAIQALAAWEGVLLDTTYTAKTMAALLAAADAGETRGPVVFWHTGGAPSLFAHDPESLLLRE